MKNAKKSFVAMACAFSMLATTPSLVGVFTQPVIAEAQTSSAYLTDFYVRKSGAVSISYNVDFPGKKSGLLVVQHKQTGKTVFSKIVTDGNKATWNFYLPYSGEYKVYFKSTDPYAVKYQNIKVSVKGKTTVVW